MTWTWTSLDHALLEEKVTKLHQPIAAPATPTDSNFPENKPDKQHLCLLV